nr:E3 ubiquitin-protein ligase RNF5-like [Drosophila kikkawai]XP_041631022.1 E3 ubiquitin-protein ligase RNF5-like [Drosophila kikkawai]
MADEVEFFAECSICLDSVRYPVVTCCGHLFCWPCLRRWITSAPERLHCPLCRSPVNKEKVIMLCGGEYPPNKFPPRPTLSRPILLVALMLILAVLAMSLNTKE